MMETRKKKGKEKEKNKSLEGNYIFKIEFLEKI